MDAQIIGRFAWAGDREALLAELFYRHVEAADVAQREAEAVVGPVRLLADLAGQRSAGTPVVAVSNPDWDATASVLAIITDDFAFLVDSVTAELTRLGIGIRLVAHPIVSVTRDGAGRLLSLQRSDGSQPTLMRERRDESWMYFEVDRLIDAQAHRALGAEVARVLDDVRKAVNDWQAMVRVARRLAADLTSAPPRGIPAEELRGAVDLLRWLADDHFTFLGYRQYRLVEGQAKVRGDQSATDETPAPSTSLPPPRVDQAGNALSLVSEPGSGLGLLRSGMRHSVSFSELPISVRRRALEPRLLILTKANSRSTVHRPVYLDYIGVKVFDPEGLVIGEHRFIGLLTSAAYTQSVTTVPVIDRKVRRVRRALGLQRGSHTDRDLMTFLETFPRDELFAIALPDLIVISEAALNLKERRASRLFVWHDTYLRFLSCLVYVPRDRYSTDLRLRIQQEVMRAVGGVSVEFTARVTESVLARVHLVVRVPRGESVPAFDVPALEARIAALARSWEDDLATLLGQHTSQEGVAAWMGAFPEGFPAAFKAGTPPDEAVRDLIELRRLGASRQLLVAFHEAGHDSGVGANARLRLYSSHDISLAQVLPVLASLGSSLITEHPFQLVLREADGSLGHRFIFDFGLAVDPRIDLVARRRDWEEAFLACWQGHAEVDRLNGLVSSAGLKWQDVSILRAYARYLRQIRGVYSPEYIEGALLAYPRIAALLVGIFAERFDPERVDPERVDPERVDSERVDSERVDSERVDSERVDGGAGADQMRQELAAHLDAVVSLDHDRILRLLCNLVRATRRTNHYRPERGALAIKLAPQLVRETPAPRPLHEVWVCSPRMEGVHLRFADVARGGIRWSDRPEDFRTEVLGLARAQQVKNALIVPGGAKGGFVVKRAPDATADRAAWLDEGVAAYSTFIASLLDVTDNYAGDDIVGPPAVVRHDDADPYLVVAADKGTATFSDVANRIAAERGFWLGDAFASGGSAGFDHKAMGITARGAWESVRAHLRRMGRDADNEVLSVVGIGDMSGDVFGNGMLLSARLRLVAAFDHRHIFLDPDPDPAVSFAERKRLFQLPRSSWADYDPALISPGGGVFSRAAKAIPVTEQVAQVLSFDPDVSVLTPAQLVRAILTADVDLLWNGGIGTFVKASAEQNTRVGDRANDGVRVDGGQLRAKVVAEGGNLGFTQRGRIEAARSGVRINTDAIDNSAGVDTSDHEVNLKILLDRLVARGHLPIEQRNPLLAATAGEVAGAVLHDNATQNAILGFEVARSPSGAGRLARLMRLLERESHLDRQLEALPDDARMAEILAGGEGLTGPELAVLLAHTKLNLRDRLLGTPVPDEAFGREWLVDYFPSAIRERYSDQLQGHPLRRQIVATGLANEMIDQVGLTYVLRAQEESGAGVDAVTRAFGVTRGVFGVSELWEQIDSASAGTPAAGVNAMRAEVQRLVDRSTRWLLAHRGATLDVPAEIERFRPIVTRLTATLPQTLVGAEQERLRRQAAELTALGVAEPLAQRIAGLLAGFSLLDVVEIHRRTLAGPETVAGVYFTVSEHFDVDALLSRISDLPRDDRWAALARTGLRADLYAALAALAERVIRWGQEGVPDQLVARWEANNAEALARGRAMLAEIAAAGTYDLATLTVALRTFRALAVPDVGLQGRA